MAAEKIAEVSITAYGVLPVYDALQDSTDQQWGGNTDDNGQYYILFSHDGEDYAVPRFMYNSYLAFEGMSLDPEHGELQIAGHKVRRMTDIERYHWDSGYYDPVVDQWHNLVLDVKGGDNDGEED